MVIEPEPARVLESLAETRPSLLLGVPRFYEKLCHGFESRLAALRGWRAKLAEMALRSGDRWAESRRQGHRPGLAARVRLLFDDQRGDLRHEEEWEAVFFPLKEPLDVEAARTVDHDPRDFREEPPPGAVYGLPEARLDNTSFFRSVEKEIEE